MSAVYKIKRRGISVSYPTFWGGVASIFNIHGVPAGRINTLDRSEIEALHNDSLTLRGDFEVVSKDYQKAVKKIGKQTRQT